MRGSARSLKLAFNLPLNAPAMPRAINLKLDVDLHRPLASFLNP